jgi:nucleotide-binding universal stress UspA family protein
MALELKDLLVVHGCEVPRGYFKKGISHEEALERVKAHSRKVMDEFLAVADIPESLEVQVLVEEGDGHSVLAQVVEQERNDILVVGARGMTAAATVLVGRTALKILHAVRCSVWIDKPEGQPLSFFDAVGRIMGLHGRDPRLFRRDSEEEESSE